jgi:transposase
MSLPTFSGQMAFFDVQNLLGSDFAPDNRFRLFADTIYPLLVAARPALAEAYCQDNGRPGVEPVLLLGVSILQFMDRCPDRTAVEMLKYHLGWKLALQQELGLKSFDPSTLVYFRQRLLEHGQAKLAFDTVLEGLQRAGLVSKRGPRRLDSTHVLGLVARMSVLEMLRETLRLAMEELAAVADLKQPDFWTMLWERYVQSKLDYQLADATLAQKQIQAGEDIALLVAWAQTQGPEIQRGPKMQLLQRVLQENFQMVQDQLQKMDQSSGAVKNPHDPEVTWCKKSSDKSTQWEGYKVQVEETVPPQPTEPGQPTEGFITAMVTQPAIGSEDAGMQQAQVEQRQSGLEPASELYVDSGYISAGRLREAAEAQRELIGPAKSSSQAGVFRTDAFDVDVEKKTAVCPAGQPASACQGFHDGRSGKMNYRFGWGEACASCPLKDQCLGKKQSRRTLEVTEDHAFLQQRRREQKTGEFAKRMRKRNAIEGTISELVRGHGLRHARYRGLEKVGQQNYFIGAACNAKRWLRLAAFRMKQAAQGAVEQVRCAFNGPSRAVGIS